MCPTLLICASLLMSDGDSGRCVTEDGANRPVGRAGIEAGEAATFTLKIRRRQGEAGPQAGAYRNTGELRLIELKCIEKIAFDGEKWRKMAPNGHL